jgi:hypothetical protein
MKRLVVAVLVFLLGLSIVARRLVAQQQPAAEISFEVSEPLKLPPDMYFGEIAGVALNSKRHVFVYTRTGAPGRSVLDGQAAQLFEFGPDGNFIKEIGAMLYSKGWAHSVRVDKEDNIWLVDNGSDEVVKLGPDYRFKMVLGRRPEAVGERQRRPPIPAGTPAPPARRGWFNEPTDVAWDSQGNIFISDGYQNSNVHKFDKDGHIVKLVGSKGAGPLQFSTPHGIAVDNQGNVYIADRANGRIQVLDNDLNYLREIKYQPETSPNYQPPIPDFGPAKTQADKKSPVWTLWPNTLCITPGSTQYIYVNDFFPGKIEKFTLDGKLVGQFGVAGRKPGQMGWVHAISCVSENEIWTGELLNWRVQRWVLHPEKRMSRATP